MTDMDPISYSATTQHSHYAQLVQKFEHEHPNMRIALGNADAILNVAHKIDFKKAIVALRDSCLCPKHKSLLSDVLADRVAMTAGQLKHEHSLEMTRCPLLLATCIISTIGQTNELLCTHAKAMSEFVIRYDSASIAALRFNVYVNDKLLLTNVIADGAVVATDYGSSGYFRSVARCTMSTGGRCIGIAFIAPTTGISNLILDATDKVCIEVVRADRGFSVHGDGKLVHKESGICPIKISIERTTDAVAVFGLSDFSCSECKKLREPAAELTLNEISKDKTNTSDSSGENGQQA